MRIITARVVKGLGRGRKIGVPTINLDSSGFSFKHGIYVCRTRAPFFYWGVMHFGPKPTFGEGVSFEMFLFNYEGEKVPADIEVEIHKYIRGIGKFESSEAMVEQIKKDVVVAKDYIGNHSI